MRSSVVAHITFWSFDLSHLLCLCPNFWNLKHWPSKFLDLCVSTLILQYHNCLQLVYFLVGCSLLQLYYYHIHRDLPYGAFCYSHPSGNFRCLNVFFSIYIWYLPVIYWDFFLDHYPGCCPTKAHKYALKSSSPARLLWRFWNLLKCILIPFSLWLLWWW